MNSQEINAVIERIIKDVAESQKISLPAIKDTQEIVDDLGFTSLSVASLIANLEEELGVDPFQSEDVMITDIRTIGDLKRVYLNCLEARAI